MPKYLIVTEYSDSEEGVITAKNDNEAFKKALNYLGYSLVKI